MASIKDDFKSAIQSLADTGKLDPISVIELLKAIDDGGFAFDAEGRLIGILDPHNDLTVIADHKNLFRQAAEALAKKHNVTLTEVMLGRGNEQPLKLDDFVKNNDYLLGDAQYDGMFRENESQFPAMEMPHDPTESEFSSSGEAVASLLGVDNNKPADNLKDAKIDSLDKFLDPKVKTDHNDVDAMLDTPKQDEPVENQNLAQGAGGSSLLGLLSGAGRLAGQPFKFGNNLIKSNVNSITDWRKNRPAQKLSALLKAEKDLVENLGLFRQGKFKDYEAAVLKNAGWTPDIAMKFEDDLHTDPDFMRDWKLTTTQLREYEDLSKSAMKLNGTEDKADAAYDEISASIDRVGEAGGPIPAEMDKGNVKSTFEEKTNMLKEFIQRMVKKLLNKVFGSPVDIVRSHMSPSP